MINAKYSEMVFERYILGNKKNKTPEEIMEHDRLGKVMTEMELKMSSKDIIESVRKTWEHIPAR